MFFFYFGWHWQSQAEKKEQPNALEWWKFLWITSWTSSKRVEATIIEKTNKINETMRRHKENRCFPWTKSIRFNIVNRMPDDENDWEEKQKITEINTDAACVSSIFFSASFACGDIDVVVEFGTSTSTWTKTKKNIFFCWFFFLLFFRIGQGQQT